MIKVIEESKGIVITVNEQQIQEGIEEVAQIEGVLLSPEGSATYVGMQKLLQKEWIKEQEEVLLFNTGSWYKYR